MTLCLYVVPANHVSLSSGDYTFWKCLLMLPVKMCNNNIAAHIPEHRVGKKSWFTLQISALFQGDFFYLVMTSYCFLV